VSDLHAVLASMSTVEALNFVIDYLGADCPTDTDYLDTPNTFPDYLDTSNTLPDDDFA
jgi:hypothetical protein